jgi:hypothetical protein
MPERHFRLLDHIGLDADGNPQPIHEVGLAVLTPTMKDGEVVDVSERITLNAAPGTRVQKTSDPRVAEALLASGQYEETEAPSKRDLAKERAATQDAREAPAKTDSEDGEQA